MSSESLPTEQSAPAVETPATGAVTETPTMPSEPVPTPAPVLETPKTEVTMKEVKGNEDVTPLSPNSADTPTRLPSPEGEANGGQAALAPAQTQGAVATPAPATSAGERAGGDVKTDTAQMVGNEPQTVESEPQNGVNQAPRVLVEPVESPKPTVAAKAETSSRPMEFIKSLFIKAKQTILFRKQKKLNKILDYAGKNGRVNNDQVEKLLRVSDATASRYLRELVKNGQLTLAGKGRGAYYQKAK
jgi:hypothetical protein